MTPAASRAAARGCGWRPSGSATPYPSQRARSPTAGPRRATSRPQRRALVASVCNTSTLVGEMLNSGAPLDVAFWVTHPAVERMWQRKALSGTLTDMEWSTDAATCVGHHPEYVMRWHDARYDDPAVVSHNLTNVEFCELINPANPGYATAIPYVYDHFNWTVCVDSVHGEVGADLMYGAPWVSAEN